MNDHPRHDLWMVHTLVDHMAGSREATGQYILDASKSAGSGLTEVDAVTSAMEILCSKGREMAANRRPRRIVVTVCPVGGEPPAVRCQAKAEWSDLGKHYRDQWGERVQSRDPKVKLFRFSEEV